MEVEDRIQILKEFFDNTISAGDRAVNCIRESIYMLKEIPPSDVPNTFSKQQRVISNLDDLQWIIYSLNNSKTKLEEEILNIKSPDITYLIREGRIGTDLINIETYNRNKEKLEPLMTKQNAINNTISYLMTLEGNLSKYLYMLRDRLNVR
ncbi:hypothetical protein [uncultured Clostridium sp.]|uniref:hypothetical protein n=1 Tax=uncultured Clostridium sp. TaxID=59620 RepID=UPI002633C347|nr:hypothetical protein [uncultured Clostridium sp.]